MQFEFKTVRHIEFGMDRVQDLATLVDENFDGQNIFVISDKGVQDTGLLVPIIERLEAKFKLCLYTDVVADPPEQTIDVCLEAAKRFSADIVIGFGGGSSMDTAKLIAVLLKSNQPLADMYGVNQVRGQRQTPLILIPTTAGTGSEVTPISIVTTGKTTKMGVVSNQLYADLAVLDPCLTIKLPSHVTAATGIDAMVHAIEAFTSKHKKNPISDRCAVQALQLLSGSLIGAIEDGTNIEARNNMLLGAMLAGQAFANAPVAAVHALAYPLGGIFHVSHGLSNALVLPSVLRFNTEVAAPLYAQLAPLFDPKASGDDFAMTQSLIHNLENLIDLSGIETRLCQLGIGKENLAQLADDAMLQTRLLQNNPKEVMRDDAYCIYESIL